MKSIKQFLIIIILSTITLTSFLSAIHGYQDSIDKAEQLFDSELIDKAHLLSLSLPQTGKGNSLNGTDKKIKHTVKTISFEADKNGQFAFQVWEEKQLILQSKKIIDFPLDHFKPGLQTVNFSNHRWRIYYYFHELSKRTVITAERIDIRYLLAENIVLETIIPMMMILPVLAFIIGSIISYGLLPLKQLSKTLTNKKTEDLSPIAIEKQPTELMQVVQSINDLLRRLKSAFLREKHFASDAAHELRTPISALKIHLHNLRQDVPENNHNIDQLQASVDRMEHLVKQILNLNRTSLEDYNKDFNHINLYSLTQDVIAREYCLFERKNLQVELEGEPIFVSGDNFALDILLQNLVTNACKYTPENGKILIFLKEMMIKNKSYVQLCIHDSGPGVPKEQYDRLFDRFYRLNGDRHNSGTTGCGLGLAIVRQIVELHHASISFDQSPILNGFLVNILFSKADKI